MILGGGEDFWYPAGNEGAYRDHPAKDPTEASKGEEGNLVRQAQRMGYEYVSDEAGLKASTSGKLLGLFANEEMFEHRNEGQGGGTARRSAAHHGPEGARRARRRPGRLLPRASRRRASTRWPTTTTPTCCSRPAGRSRPTVRVALDFQADHPDTLIVVAGDHETGGLVIENEEDADESGDGESVEDGPFTIKGTDIPFYVDWTSEGHSAVDTPVTAGGPGAWRLNGVIDNTEVYTAMKRAMGLQR